MRRRPPILSRHTKIVLIAIVVFIVGFSAYLLLLPNGKPKNPNTYSLKPRLATPEEVRGIYVTSFSAANPETRKKLTDLVDQTELNTMVIDLKDVTGKLVFRPKRESLKKTALSPVLIEDLNSWIEDLHQRGIYTVARVMVFMDSAAVKAHPEWAIRSTDGGAWRDWTGSYWIDPGCQEAWEYIADIGKEAYDLGFDELNLDYIRFPSDGPLSKMVFNYHRDDEYRKYKTMTDFFSWIDSSLNYLPMPISVDIFGLSYLKQNPEDDMNIGQRVIDCVDHFDYIMPMVYPSHYPDGFLGFSNPAEHPYEVVKESLLVGREIIESADGSPRLTRPWIQDFNMGAVYTPEMVRGQIQAAREEGASGWIVWNAKNEYTEEAFQ